MASSDWHVETLSQVAGIKFSRNNGRNSKNIQRFPMVSDAERPTGRRVPPVLVRLTARNAAMLPSIQLRMTMMPDPQSSDSAWFGHVCTPANPQCQPLISHVGTQESVKGNTAIYKFMPTRVWSYNHGMKKNLGRKQELHCLKFDIVQDERIIASQFGPTFGLMNCKREQSSRKRKTATAAAADTSSDVGGRSPNSEVTDSTSQSSESMEPLKGRQRLSKMQLQQQAQMRAQMQAQAYQNQILIQQQQLELQRQHLARLQAAAAAAQAGASPAPYDGGVATTSFMAAPAGVDSELLDVLGDMPPMMEVPDFDDYEFDDGKVGDNDVDSAPSVANSSATSTLGTPTAARAAAAAAGGISQLPALDEHMAALEGRSPPIPATVGDADDAAAGAAVVAATAAPAPASSMQWDFDALAAGVNLEDPSSWHDTQAPDLDMADGMALLSSPGQDAAGMVGFGAGAQAAPAAGTASIVPDANNPYTVNLGAEAVGQQTVTNMYPTMYPPEFADLHNSVRAEDMLWSEANRTEANNGGSGTMVATRPAPVSTAAAPATATATATAATATATATAGPGMMRTPTKRRSSGNDENNPVMQASPKIESVSVVPAAGSAVAATKAGMHSKLPSEVAGSGAGAGRGGGSGEGTNGGDVAVAMDDKDNNNPPMMQQKLEHPPARSMQPSAPVAEPGIPKHKLEAGTTGAANNSGNSSAGGQTQSVTVDASTLLALQQQLEVQQQMLAKLAQQNAALAAGQPLAVPQHNNKPMMLMGADGRPVSVMQAHTVQMPPQQPQQSGHVQVAPRKHCTLATKIILGVLVLVLVAAAVTGVALAVAKPGDPPGTTTTGGGGASSSDSSSGSGDTDVTCTYGAWKPWSPCCGATKIRFRHILANQPASCASEEKATASCFIEDAERCPSPAHHSPSTIASLFAPNEDVTDDDVTDDGGPPGYPGPGRMASAARPSRKHLR